MGNEARRGRPLRGAATTLALALLSTVIAVTAAPLAASADTSWRPAAGAVPASGSYAYVTSASGDFIGQGRTYLYTPARSDLTATVTTTRLTFTIAGFEDWTLQLEAPSGQTFAKDAVYTGLTRYPFNGAEGGISFGGEGRGCNANFGWAAFDDLVISANVVQSFLLRFEQRCESPSAAPLRGQIRWDRNEPTPPAPNPVATVPADRWAPSPGSVPSAGPYLYLSSQAGDYIGQGKTALFVGDRVVVDPKAGSRLTMDVPFLDGVSWDLEMAGSNRADQLGAGYYADLQRYPFHNKVVGGFSFTGSGRGCSSSTSWVVIDELDMRLAKLSDLSLRFEQRCGTATAALRGALRWEAPAPAGTPGAPTGVTATPVVEGATVAWSAPTPGSSAITGYQVIVYERGNAVSTVDLPATARSTTIDGLGVGVPHRFKVRAVNASGAGARSNVTATIAPLDPRPAITGLTPAAGPRSGGTPVQIAGSSFTGATAVTVGGSSVAFSVVSDARIDITSPPLTAGVHDVQVTTPAGTSVVVDVGRWTASRLAPSSPTGVAGAPRPGAIDASWTAPASAGDDPITGYTVTATRAGQTRPQATIAAAAAATTAALTGLTPGATYTVQVTAINANGPSPTASSAPVAVPAPVLGPFGSISSLVRQQWLDFVGRPPTASESAAGVSAITDGSTTSEAFIASMSRRREWTTDRAAIIRLYSAYFGRLPDWGGLAYWEGKLRTGTTLNRVSSTFASSSEFQRRYGTLSNRSFVLLIYTNVLKRSPDASGVSFWTRRLDGGMSRGQVMTSFSESGENVRKTQPTVDVVLLHAGMLRTIPNAATVATEVAALAGGTPLSDLAGRILVSSGYGARF